MFGVIFLFACGVSSADHRRHGRKEEDVEFANFDGQDMGNSFLDQEFNDNDEPEIVQSQENLADRYLKDFDKYETQGQKYQAIIWALTELASLIDSAATRYEIEYEIGGHLHTVLNSVDVRDREMKKQFQELQKEVDTLKEDIDKLINNTRAELQESMKSVRKDIVKSLRETVTSSLSKNRDLAQSIRKKVEGSVGQYKKTTTTQAVSYFVGFQVLLFLCVYFYTKYIQQIRLG